MKSLKLGFRAVQIIAVVLPMILLGCSSDIPSESKTKVTMERYLASRKSLKGAAKLESFAKTNGLKQEKNGVELYVFDYASEISFPNGLMPECLSKSANVMKCFDAQLDGVMPRKV